MYSAHATELRVAYQYDTRTLLRLILQYKEVAHDLHLSAPVEWRERDVFAQVLFSYKVNAQTAIYFGYTAGARGTGLSPLTKVSRTLFAKFGYAW